MHIPYSTAVLTACLFALSVTACTPSAYTRYRSPTINGQINISGAPASGIPVYLSIEGKDQNCSKALLHDTTDQDGRFNIRAAREEMSYTPLMTYYLDEWNLCADVSGQRVLLYSDNRYGMGSVNGSVNIVCEFEPGHFSTKNCRRGL